MGVPPPSRPQMPGYGLLGPDEGTGLLPWSWVADRLTSSHDYWLATVRADGRPHVMPVWAVWHDGALWFATSVGSRKARNLTADPRCTITTDNALEPVVVEGIAELVTDHHALADYIGRENAKYGTDYGVEFVDPNVNATFHVGPTWVFSLTEDDFVGSPTSWTFSSHR